MNEIKDTGVEKVDKGIENLCANSVELIHYARNIAVKQVNIIQIMTYFSLGKWIVETQQMGEKAKQFYRADCLDIIYSHLML